MKPAIETSDFVDSIIHFCEEKNPLVWLCSGCANFFKVSESKIRSSLGHCQVNESSEVTAGDATIRKFV